MTDAAASESESVFRLIYHSQSLIPSDQRRTELAAIFTTARRTNERLGITGALVISDDAFVQALEGDETAVRELYASITKDTRHDSVRVLEEKMVERRTFGRWAMAKVATDDGPDLRLLSHATKGVIVVVPGKDPSITSEQETVLAYMRDAIGL